MTLPGREEILVLGGMAFVLGADGKPLPGVAPAATQRGKYAAELIRGRLTGREASPFRYRDVGMMTMIGRSAAVAALFGWRLRGFAAWLIWLFAHLTQLAQFQNRLLVFVQWAWNYVTFNRSARLLTGEESFPAPSNPAAPQAKLSAGDSA